MFLDILLFILILAFLIIAHEYGHFSTARMFRMYVEEFAIGFPPRIFSRVRKGLRLSVGAVPFGGYVKIPGENGKEVLAEEQKMSGMLAQDAAQVSEDSFFYAKPAWQRVVVLSAGVFMNFVIGWLFLSAVFMVGVPQQVLVSAVAADSPAAAAGVQAGDVLKGFTDGDEFIRQVREQAGSEFSFIVMRNGEELSVAAVPRENPPQGEGALGVSIETVGVEKQSLFPALGNALVRAWEFFSMIFVLIARLIASVVSGEDLFSQLAGPVGIFQATSQAANMGFVYVANLIALISLNLAALNIFPFPALDGGRIVLVVAEKLKGSPVRMKTQLWLNGAGFVILILFLIAVSIQDIGRLL
jgi:regulator of sigma E protease